MTARLIPILQKAHSFFKEAKKIATVIVHICIAGALATAAALSQLIMDDEDSLCLDGEPP